MRTSTLRLGFVVMILTAFAAGQTVVDQAKLVDLQKLGQEVAKTQTSLDQILRDRGVPELQQEVLDLLGNNGDSLATADSMRNLARAQRSVLDAWDRSVTARHFEVLEKIDGLRAGLSGEIGGSGPNRELVARASRMNETLDELAKQIQATPEGPERQRLKDRFARLFVLQQRTEQAAERPGNAAVAKVLSHVGEQLDRYTDLVEARVFDTELQRVELVAQVELLETLADMLQIVALGEGLEASEGLKLDGMLASDVLEKLVSRLDEELGTVSGGAVKPVMSSPDIEAEIYRRATRDTAGKPEAPLDGEETISASQPSQSRSRSYLEVLRPQTGPTP